MVSALVLVMASYLLGSVPVGYLLVKWLRGMDIREHGSRNIGATNVRRVTGSNALGYTVLMLDVSKGLVAVVLLAKLAGYLLGAWPAEWLKVVAGLAAIAGHNWTIFLRFKGGKGVATSLGVFLGISPVALLVAFLVYVLFSRATRIVSAGSISAALALPVAMFFLREPPVTIGFGVVAAVILIARHKENIKRLIRGEEAKFK